MPSPRRVLGIDVDDDLFEKWSQWFAPDPQPFLIPAVSELCGIGEPLGETLTDPQLRDTYEAYGPRDGFLWQSVSSSTFAELSRDTRAALVRIQHTQGRPLVPSVRSFPQLKSHDTTSQADGHRFVWWPQLLASCATAALTAYVEEGRRPSLHREVPDAVWKAASTVLPNARALGGTFARASGPNCFGTVMAVAGIDGVNDVWVQREPFEIWLEAATWPGGSDDEPGTVLVWRSPDGRVQHAAVTLGGGWALHKPSQGWMSPIKVLSTRDLLASARSVGRRLTRRHIV